uniref:Uncharacterized protein n=1 Tax=Candidatus Kentrum sp. DK TaxID=2126562 RepID=A0A450TC76_9GAMM|nr:MAG: hypothetical protein BECKDK2373B_GA0170837_11375 [Candidatus Kentron sp. DK]
MPDQNIDATLSPADVKAIKAALDTVLQKMPFLINLTKKGVRSFFFPFRSGTHRHGSVRSSGQGR